MLYMHLALWCYSCKNFYLFYFYQRQLVAIKAMIDSTDETITATDYFDNYTVSLKSYQMIRKEVSFLSTLHHDNLTQLCGVSTSPFMLLIELAPLGSLRAIIKEYKAADKAFKSPVLCQSMSQVSNVGTFKCTMAMTWYDVTLICFYKNTGSL